MLLLHSSWSTQVSHLAAWVSEGLRRHEFVAYVRKEQADATGGPSLTRAVEQAVTDWPLAIRGGQLETWDVTQTLSVHDLESGQAPEHELMSRAEAGGYNGVRVVMEDCPALDVVPGEDWWLARERQVDQLCREAPFSAMCRYRNGLDKSFLLDVAEIHHRHVIDSILKITSSTEAQLRLVGEVDISNSAVLESALRGVCASATDAVRVDLEELEFADVSACRALARGTELLRLRTGRAVLSNPQPGVEKTLRLLRLHLLPGVELVGDEPL